MFSLTLTFHYYITKCLFTVVLTFLAIKKNYKAYQSNNVTHLSTFPLSVVVYHTGKQRPLVAEGKRWGSSTGTSGFSGKKSFPPVIFPPYSHFHRFLFLNYFFSFSS